MWRILAVLLGMAGGAVALSTGVTVFHLLTVPYLMARYNMYPFVYVETIPVGAALGAVTVISILGYINASRICARVLAILHIGLLLEMTVEAAGVARGIGDWQNAVTMPLPTVVLPLIWALLLLRHRATRT